MYLLSVKTSIEYMALLHKFFFKMSAWPTTPSVVAIRTCIYILQQPESKTTYMLWTCSGIIKKYHTPFVHTLLPKGFSLRIAYFWWRTWILNDVKKMLPLQTAQCLVGCKIYRTYCVCMGSFAVFRSVIFLSGCSPLFTHMFSVNSITECFAIKLLLTDQDILIIAKCRQLW